MGTKEVLLHELYIVKGQSADDLLKAVCDALDRVEGHTVHIEIHGLIDD